MRPLLLVLLLAGCKNEMSLNVDGDPEAADFDTALRLDVFPTAEMVAADGPLLPQTWHLDSLEQQLPELILEPPVTLEGRLFAFEVSPWADADLPGSAVAVADAHVSIEQADTLQSATDITEDGQRDEGERVSEPGDFSLRVAPSADYVASFVPADADLPFGSFPLSLLADTELDVDLGYGATVWGEALDAVGQPVAGIGVRAVDAYGVAGPLAHTDANGFYLLRVQPGAPYTLVSEGRGDGLDPQLTVAVALIDEAGLSVDFTYAPRDLRTVRGRAVGEDGIGRPGVTARFVSQSLDGYGPEASFEISFQTNDAGHFPAVLLPGVYDLELLPASGDPSSPIAVSGIVVDDPLEDLGTLTLPGLAPIDDVVVDPAGNPVPGALVSVSEVGFGGRVWQATADAAGRFLIDASRGPVVFELAPPADRADLPITRVRADSGAAAPPMAFSTATEIAGSVSWRDANGDVHPAAFTVVEARDATGARRGVAFTDADGQFSMRIAP